MTKCNYLAAICHGNAGFGVVFLDFPGCTSAGDTLEEALAMGKEALEGHIAVMRDYGDTVPEPSQHTIDDVDEWLNDPEEPDAERWVGLYPIEVDRDPHGDVSVALPRALVRGLDEATPDARRFIIETAWRELDRLKKSA